jgi:hypothetical protein
MLETGKSHIDLDQLGLNCRRRPLVLDHWISRIVKTPPTSRTPARASCQVQELQARSGNQGTKRAGRCESKNLSTDVALKFLFAR